MANQTSNQTGPEPGMEEQEGRIREVQALLRDMRYRSCDGQRNLAENEKTQAEKCKFVHRTHTSINVTPLNLIPFAATSLMMNPPNPKTVV